MPIIVNLDVMNGKKRKGMSLNELLREIKLILTLSNLSILKTGKGQKQSGFTTLEALLMARSTSTV